MKFVFFAASDFKSAVVSMKLAAVVLYIISVVVLVEVVSSGWALGLAPNLAFGSGLIGALIAYLIFDTGNTILRKRKVARFLTYVIAFAGTAVGVLSALESEMILGWLIAVLSLVLLGFISTQSARNFFTSK